jgi:tRNA-dihydrouridine synthase A
MIGRAAYKTPWHTLANSDRLIFGEEENPCASRRQLLTDYAEMCDRALEERGPMESSHMRSVVRKMVKPLLGMFHGEPGTNKWRRQIETSLHGNPSTASEVIFASMEHVASEVLDAGPEVRFTHTRNEKGETVLSVVE